ncbi:uncharacterized protein LOC132257971 [Phlebotomus argentipes]|uniref:uncharacterized protein LOC132257971 n=1 Tax=Phlebotomus argentipes TaxID=94469 RepID=UPI00289326F5|nr:uncharacterized protein LOC132257971 [Phlebotomus argentipes]
MELSLRMETICVLLAIFSSIFPPIDAEWVKISIDPGERQGVSESGQAFGGSQFLRDTLAVSEKGLLDDFQHYEWKKSHVNREWVTKKSPAIAVSWIMPEKTPETTTFTPTKAPEMTTVGTTEAGSTESSAKPIKKQNRDFSFSGFFAFLKSIQDSFMNRTKRSIEDKLKYLKDIRDKLLREIEKKINALWPAEEIPPKRVKRHIIPSPEGHMDFPSSEGALMTICFLTFAVFLIKLVLQVINTIKSKHYSFNGFDTKTPAPIKIIKNNRNARRFSLTNTENVQTIASVTEAIHPAKGRF